ncbi:hypothetical protein [Streptomyces sp. NBC_00658]|uniref:MmyB family transcriptional regulator n=1 Tax=Streptomyces sp. NBC_00658 TaxID=2975800 RepID=UPI00386722DB
MCCAVEFPHRGKTDARVAAGDQDRSHGRSSWIAMFLMTGVGRRPPTRRSERPACPHRVFDGAGGRLERRKRRHRPCSVVPRPPGHHGRVFSLTLRCDPNERDHLYHLAGFSPPARYSGGYVRPGLMSLLDRLRDIPACVVSDLGQVLWQNTLAAITLAWTAGRRADRAANIVWRWFTEPALRTCFPEEDWPRHSLAHVSDLRATSARLWPSFRPRAPTHARSSNCCGRSERRISRRPGDPPPRPSAPRPM